VTHRRAFAVVRRPSVYSDSRTMPSDPRLSTRERRVILEQLTRDRLGELTTRFELDVEDRRSIDSHIDAIVRKRSLDFAVLLNELRREELQAGCRSLGLDEGGREKAKLVERIVSLAAQPSRPDVTDGAEDAASPVHEGASSVPVGLVLTPAEPKNRRAPSLPRTKTGDPVGDYRHLDASRTNNPPAGLVEFDRPPAKKTREYAYDPHLDPQLVWAGKKERTSFEVDTVSLHIHERVSTQAILQAVKREDAQRSLFADHELPEGKAIEFYSHDVGWANRMVLGDSLLVMNSLLERERMAGKVQCIYMDPPYGVKFNSNFQPSISRRDVKDGDDASLTREPEQIQAYRDTWELGIHSYLTYMRDRLLLARDLLAETGSIFVQISDENVHHVRELLDEVFGRTNHVSSIVFSKTTSQTTNELAVTCDYLLWYAKAREQTKIRPLFLEKQGGDAGAGVYSILRSPSGETRRMSASERRDPSCVPQGWRIYRLDNMTSQSVGREKGEGAASWFAVTIDGQDYRPSGQSRWKTNEAGMQRLLAAGRVVPSGVSLAYVRFLDDFPVQPLSNVWTDTGTGSFTEDKHYVVQTGLKVVGRCILMTTDPGDLVLDPTCGSGTTAIVAEQWGRRWVTCDTSRVALSLARQRMLTAKYPFFRLRSDRVRDGFLYRTVPHITLKSIAQNQRLDALKTRQERDRAISESAEQEILYDQPEEDKGRIRVSGPFTVEAIPVASLDDANAAPDEPPDVQGAPSPTTTTQTGRVSDPAGDYLSWMVDQVRKSGIHFAAGRTLKIPTLRLVRGPYEYLHAEGASDAEGDPRRIAISFGSKHAPVTPMQVRDALVETRGYDWVIFVGFGCDPEARRMIDQGVHGRQLDFANAAPDMLVGDLLKTRKTDKLFTVFGAPDVKLHKEPDAYVSAELLGVDLYDPMTGNTNHGKGEDVAAWFVDHDYDGRTFCICQALFPGRSTKNPWEKLQKALKGTIDEEKFDQLRTTRSLPFKPGKKVAVTVIDDRGNEVIKIVESAKALR
jgi:adenine-specific DNA-methyltransferase